MKFKIGDKILWSAPNHLHDGIERTVVGYTSTGKVVYEYMSEDQGTCVQFWNEDAFKLVPVKKEGWVNVYNRPSSGDRTGEVIYSSKDEAMRNRGLVHHVAVVHIEWEE